MDTTLEDQALLVTDPVVGHPPKSIDVNPEDDFDFEIGSDDGFELSEEAGNEDGDLIDQNEVTEDHVDQPEVDQAQDQEPQASVAENDDHEGHDYGQQEVVSSAFGPDSLTGTNELTQDVQNDTMSESKNELVVDQEEIYYEEAAGDIEGVDNTLPPEAIQDDDLVNTATSVDHVHEENDYQERPQEADEDDAETGNEDFQDSPLVTETIQQTAEELEREEHSQNDSVAAEADSGEAIDISTGAMLAETYATGGAVTEPRDQSNWVEDGDDDDDDDNGSNTSPIVTVSYRGQEYSMFAQSPEDDPNTYFLDSIDSIQRPLSQFLENVREVISSEVEAGHELFARIDGLGLEFGESTAKDFLDETTLAQIIEVNDKLSQNDGGSQHAELYIFLSVRSNPLQRFAELAKGAEEGQGLSYFEQYYEESPADVSLLDEEEQHGESRDIGSDGLSAEEPSGESEEAADGSGTLFNAGPNHNPFQVDDRQRSLNDAAISEILGAEVDPVEGETDAKIVEAQLLDENVNGSTDVAAEGDDSSFDLAATNVQTISDDHTFGGAISVVDQVETEMGEDWDHDEVVEAQDGLEATEGEEVTEEQTQLLMDSSEEVHERGDDSVANVPNDEDYLDLSHDVENQPVTTNVDAVEQFDIQQRITPNSSATATLNGEENVQGDQAIATQDPAEPDNQTPDQTNQNEDDEIDWNHEDDDDIGVADQNPTDLSPSSLSAKRSRQEDEDPDGLGEDSAAKRRRT